MNKEIIQYPEFTLTQVKAEKMQGVPEATCFSRVELPTHPENMTGMLKKGYIFADRTLGVEISLRRSNVDYQKLVRFQIREAVDEDMKAVLDIALNSFPTDRRFHVATVPDMKVAESIIRDWVEKLTNTYVCIHKDQVVGFLDLEPYGEKAAFIHLAAVLERYRAAGAAVSLYAYAILTAKERGFEKVCGRISSSNTAVMNLYAKLGGAFENPIDVFVRNEV